MRSNFIATRKRERALLVQVTWGDRHPGEAEDALRELERLADTAGAVVIGSVTQRRDKPTSSLFVGEGKLADIQSACRQFDADMVIFDHELTPVQVNNLDVALGVKVIDRTELILQIFARRARSSEAQTQVELAQLEYLVSRVPVSARQQRFQGGIGMRGPGESPFQLRAEPMRRRIHDLKKKLKKIQKRRERTRNRRAWPLVCLTGYTNAGKSTLLNALSSSDAYVDDRLFATLDTKTRRVHLGEGADVLLTDTVGFIRNLPHGLVASFRSTLEEVSDAGLVMIVADAGHPCVTDHLEVVHKTITEIDASAVPSILVLNKADTARARSAIPALTSIYDDAYVISAATGYGLDDLKYGIARHMAGTVTYAG